MKETRELRGFTRKEFAERLFVSPRLISYWENGQRECDFNTLIKISTILDESIDYLLGKSDN